jgi:hypothetical protein
MSRTWIGPVRTAWLMPVALITAVLLLSGCGVSGNQTSQVTSTTAPMVSPGAPSLAGETKTSDQSLTGQSGPSAGNAARGSADAAQTIAAAAKLIVVNKTMRIETADVDKAIAKIRELVQRDGADISSMQVATAVDQPIYRQPVPLADGSVDQASSAPLRAYVTVRVPSDHYAAFVADAAKLGRVLTESESADDVTQQHVDMQARLDNLKAEQSRLRQLFAKATSVKDMLAVEQELSRVQGDIESMKAQIDYLERQAARATVTLELTEPVAIVQPLGIDWGVRSALTDSIRAFVSTMNGLIVLLGPVLAVLVFVGLPILLIVWLVVRVARRRVARHAAATEVAFPEDDAPAQDAAHDGEIHE